MGARPRCLRRRTTRRATSSSEHCADNSDRSDSDPDCDSALMVFVVGRSSTEVASVAVEEA